MSKPFRDIIWLTGRRVTAKEIISEVAHRRKLSVNEMLSPSRKHCIAHARQEAMWEIHTRLGRSLPWIAQALHLKDHTTVLHGIRAHERRLAEVQEAA